MAVKVSASASTVAAPTRMLPCAAKPVSGDAAGPVHAGRARVRGAAAVTVDDAELAVVAFVVGARQSLHDLVGGDTVAQQREPVGPVARIRVGLRRDRADPGLGPGHDRADREELRLRGDAPLAGVEVARGDRVSGDDRISHTSARSGRARGAPDPRRARTQPRGVRVPHLTSAAVAARITTGRPSAWAASSAAVSPGESSTRAPVSSTSPSSAISGTRLPVAPNQRSLTA